VENGRADAVNHGDGTCLVISYKRRHDARLPVSGVSWIRRAPLVVMGLAHSELEDVTRAPPIAIKGGGVSTSVAAVRSYGTTTVRWVHEAGDNEHCLELGGTVVLVMSK
jgi:hypothetical protein